MHEPQRQVQLKLRAQLRGLLQVGLGGRELLPVAIQHRPVVEDALHPHVIVGAAEHGQRGVVVRKGLIQPADVT